MIRELYEIHNIGQFKNWVAQPAIELAPLTLIYAENGKGKTTLANVFRSLAASEPSVINERHRLGTNSPPFVKLTTIDSQSKSSTLHCFHNSTWTVHHADLQIFDDTFIDTTVYTGNSIQPSHRSSLHDLINGPEGAKLQNQARSLRAKREEVIREIDDLKDKIKDHKPRSMTIDDFVSLNADLEVEKKISEVSQQIEGLKIIQAIKTTPLFEDYCLPKFIIDVFEMINPSDTRGTHRQAVHQVKTHIESLDDQGEGWLRSGMEHYAHRGSANSGICPFCVQPLDRSPIFEAYRTFFGDDYSRALAKAETLAAHVMQTIGSEPRGSFNHSVTTNNNIQAFWDQYANTRIQAIDVDTINTEWDEVRALTTRFATSLLNDPLTADPMPSTTLSRLSQWNEIADSLTPINTSVTQANARIKEFRTRLEAADLQELQTQLTYFEAIRLRYTEPVKGHCKKYVQLIAERDRCTQSIARCTKALTKHRNKTFNNYQHILNDNLASLLAPFSVANLEPVNHRHDYFCIYKLRILGHEVPLQLSKNQPASASFSNTLSAGDRNTLAFAIFLSSLQVHNNSEKQTIVFDDPVSSLDESRTHATIERIDDLISGAISNVDQIIVLSHRKEFLADICKFVGVDDRKALEVVGGNASSIRTWDIEAYREGERRAVELELESFIVDQQADPATIFSSIRPHLEDLLIKQYPTVLSVEDTMGPIIQKLENAANTGRISISSTVIDEMRSINRFSSPPHHSDRYTKPLDRGRVAGHVKRTLDFIRSRR